MSTLPYPSSATAASAFVREPARDIPLMADVDVVVAGGGVSGCLAAYAAAKAGCTVALVERYGYLGGLVVGWPVNLIYNSFPEEGPGEPETYTTQGPTRVLYDRVRARGGWAPHPECDGVLDPELVKAVLQQMLDEAGVTVLFDCWAAAILGEPGKHVEGIVFESKAGRRAIRARVTIDATADGDIAAHAGCTRHEEPFERHSLGLWIGGVDLPRFKAFRETEKERWKTLRELTFPGPCHLAAFNDDPANNPFAPGGISAFWTHARGDATDPVQASAMQADCRRRAYDFLDHLRAHLPGWEKAHIVSTSAQFGVRQGLRGVGQYTVTIADLKTGRRHPDEVAWVRWWEPRHPYVIPWRSLVPREVAGLIFSSRLLDCDRPAHGTLRLFAACFTIAHAAGCGAAVSVRTGTSPHRLPAAPIQALLRAQHAWIPPQNTSPATAPAAASADTPRGEH